MVRTINVKGLRQFLSFEEQRRWMDGEFTPSDTADRPESLEDRFKYSARFEDLLLRPSAH